MRKGLCLKDFPKPIIEKMLLRQKEQGNEKDITVFEKYPNSDQNHGGFTWNDTPEGWSFWDNVINKQKFNIYFDEYPEEKEEKPIIKTSVHDLTDKEVIHCTTKEESDAIRELLHKEGFKWSTGGSYLEGNKWGINAYKDIAYSVKEGLYCNSDYYRNEGYTLLPASNFINTKKEEKSVELKCIDPPKDVKVVWLRTKRTIKHEIITLPEGYVTWETEDYFNVKGNNTCIIENNRFHVNWNKEDFEVIPDPRIGVKIPDLPKLNSVADSPFNTKAQIDRDNWTWGYPSDQVRNIPNIKTPDKCHLPEFIQPQEVKTILKRKSKTIKL